MIKQLLALKHKETEKKKPTTFSRLIRQKKKKPQKKQQGNGKLERGVLVLQYISEAEIRSTVSYSEIPNS